MVLSAQELCAIEKMAAQGMDNKPGLKINGEEWIKVMDEYIAPNCTALMELGRAS